MFDSLTDCRSMAPRQKKGKLKDDAPPDSEDKIPEVTMKRTRGKTTNQGNQHTEAELNKVKTPKAKIKAVSKPKVTKKTTTSLSKDNSAETTTKEVVLATKKLNDKKDEAKNKPEKAKKAPKAVLNKITPKSAGNKNTPKSVVTKKNTPKNVLTKKSTPKAVTKIVSKSAVAMDSPKAIVTKITPKAVLTKTTPKAIVTKITPKAIVTKTTPKAIVTKITPKAVLTKTTPKAIVTKITPKAIVTKTTPKTGVTNPKLTRLDRGKGVDRSLTDSLLRNEPSRRTGRKARNLEVASDDVEVDEVKVKVGGKRKRVQNSSQVEASPAKRPNNQNSITEVTIIFDKYFVEFIILFILSITQFGQINQLKAMLC